MYVSVADIFAILGVGSPRTDTPGRYYIPDVVGFAWHPRPSQSFPAVTLCLAHGFLLAPQTSQVGLCKIADAFYASEGKGESRQSAIETLAGGNSLGDVKGVQELAGGRGAPGGGNGDVDEEEEDAKHEVPVSSAQSLPDACGAWVHGEAIGGSASVAGGSTHSDGGNEGGSSTTATAAGDTISAVKETIRANRDGVDGEDSKTSENDVPSTSSTDVSPGTRGSSSDDNVTSVAASSLSSTTIGGGNGGSGGRGDSAHEHKEGGEEEDSLSDGSSEQEQEQEQEYEHEQEKKGEDCAREHEERNEEKENNGDKEQQPQQEAEDEERVRRVRVAQSLAMYRAQLAAERRHEEVSTAKPCNTTESPTLPFYASKPRNIHELGTYHTSERTSLTPFR